MSAGAPEGRIEVRDLVVRYGEVAAVDGVSFSVARGEHVTLLGPSGCGKTTTLRAIAGLEDPSGGSIRIAGTTVYSAAERRNVPVERRGVSIFLVGPNAKVIAPAIVSAWISSSTELSAALALIQSAAVFIALIVLLRAARRYAGELP